MKVFIQSVIFITVIFVCNLAVSAQTQNNCISTNSLNNDQILTVGANLLLKEPKCYDGKVIRTFGFYRFGFDASHLFCMDCENSDLALVNTSNFYLFIKRCSLKKDLKKVESKSNKILGVVVLGVLNTKGGYGVSGVYDSEFSPICFERVDVLSNDESSPATASPKTLKRMRDWYEEMTEIYNEN